MIFVLSISLDFYHRHLSCAFVSVRRRRSSIHFSCVHATPWSKNSPARRGRWMDEYPSKRSKRDGQHHHRWSGRYMKPARRVGAWFHRNLRTCRLLPLFGNDSFLPFLPCRASCVCTLHILSLCASFSGCFQILLSEIWRIANNHYFVTRKIMFLRNRFFILYMNNV